MTAPARRDVTLAARQNTVTVPTYASACSGTSRYSSACSCWGFTVSTTTAATPTVTVTATTTATPTQTSCPELQNPYTSVNGVVYNLVCSSYYNFGANGLGHVSTPDFQSCVEVCSNTPSCTIVDWRISDNTCYLINGDSGDGFITGPAGSDYDSARLQGS